MLNLPSIIKHTHHIVMMKDGMCPFPFKGASPSITEGSWVKMYRSWPFNWWNGFRSLSYQKEWTACSSNRSLARIGRNICPVRCRSIPMSIPMNDSIVESTLGGMFIVLRTRFHRWSRTKCFLWNRRWKETNSPSLQAISAPTAYVLSFVCFNFLFWIVACVTTIFHPKQSRIVFVSPWSNVLCEDVFVHSSLCPWPRLMYPPSGLRRIAEDSEDSDEEPSMP